MKKMIHVLSNGKALFVGLLLTGCFMLVGSNTASAQWQTAASNVNPYTHIAEKLGVTAYPLGTFDRQHTMDVMETIIANLGQIVGNGGGTTLQKLKIAFCKQVLADVSGGFIAPEISLLTSLSDLNAQQSTLGTQQTMLATVYNEVVAALQ